MINWNVNNIHDMVKKILSEKNIKKVYIRMLMSSFFEKYSRLIGGNFDKNYKKIIKEKCNLHMRTNI